MPSALYRPGAAMPDALSMPAGSTSLPLPGSVVDVNPSSGLSADQNTGMPGIGQNLVPKGMPEKKKKPKNESLVQIPSKEGAGGGGGTGGVGFTGGGATGGGVTGATPTTPPIGSPNLPSYAVRATGPGPGDAAYRQNLSTFAAGDFAAPPGGMFAFNPTARSENPYGIGRPEGGGNAPTFNLPQTWLSQAEQGNNFAWNPNPAPVEPKKPARRWAGGGRDWGGDFSPRGDFIR